MKIRKAVIPAAGFGTRFLPYTKAVPKEMINLLDKPLIQYIVEEAVQSGIEEIGIIVSPKKTAIKAHFSSEPELEDFLKQKGKFDLLDEVQDVSELAEFTYIPQPEALGLGHAILMAEDFIRNEPFAVLLPDDIYVCPVPGIKQLINVFAEHDVSVIVLERVNEERTLNCGIIKPKQISDRLYQVEDLHEKPGPEQAFSDLAVVGRYVFTPEIFSAIRNTAPDHNGEIQITDAIKLLLDKQLVLGYLFEGKLYDCGNKSGYLEATLKLAAARSEFQPLIQRLMKDIDRS